MRWFALILILAFASGLGGNNLNANTLTPDNSDDTPELKILSWNIYMLPRFALSTGKRKRARKIVELLSVEKLQYDIIVFQEAFHQRARGILKRGLKEYYPYMYGPANYKLVPFVSNSGIWIVSKIPLTHLAEIDYQECEGSDCLARKGALLMEGNWHGNVFQILGTHLEAGGPFSIKESQYDEMFAMIDAHKKPGVPQFLCGDFNTAIEDPERYSTMLESLDAENGMITGEIQTTSGGGEMIDHILLRTNGSVLSSIQRRIYNWDDEWAKKDNKHIKRTDLSDHLAVEAIVKF